MGELNTGERYLVAFEIGSSKIRGAIGTVDNSGVVDVIAVEEEKLIDKVRYGCIQNVEVANALQRVIERLQAYPRIDPRSIIGVYVSLGGRTLKSTAVDVSVDLQGETEITDPIINDLCVKAAGTISSDFDVVDVVPVRFTVDNKSQNNPIGSYGQHVGARMTVLSCAPQLKRMLRRVITERLGLTINGYITRPLAEAAMVLTDDERRLGCMLVDFGAETTTTVIYRNGAPIYVATIPIGSRNITIDLTVLNYIEERAEEIKKVSGNALAQDNTRSRNTIDGIDYTDVNNYVHARADEIAANIIAQLGYAEVRDTELPGGIIIVGGGSRLRGFNELLADQSKLKVRQGSPTAAVRISDGTIDRTEMVDVISILVAAAQREEQPCLTPPATTTAPTYDERDGTYEAMYGNGGEGDDTRTSRIGHLDDDGYDAGNKTPSRRSDDDDDDDDDDDADNNSGNSPKKDQSGKKRSGISSLLGDFRRRLTELMNDNTEFDE
jgi:cell division protein FtsA